MAKIVSSSDSDDPDYVEEQSSEDGSDVERERLHKQLWRHFKLGHSREGTLIELCQELHEKKIDSDKASKWFQYVDGDASGGIEETGGWVLWLKHDLVAISKICRRLLCANRICCRLLPTL